MAVIGQGLIECADRKFRAMRMVRWQCLQEIDDVFRGDIPCFFNIFTFSQMGHGIGTGAGVHTAIYLKRDRLNTTLSDR